MNSTQVEERAVAEARADCNPDARKASLLDAWTRPVPPRFWRMDSFAFAVIGIAAFLLFGGIAIAIVYNGLSDSIAFALTLAAACGSVVLTLLAIRSFRRIRWMFREGQPVVAWLLEVQFVQKHETVIYEYSIDGKTYSRSARVPPRRHFEMFRRGPEFIVLVDPHDVAKAIVPETYLLVPGTDLLSRIRYWKWRTVEFFAAIRRQMRRLKGFYSQNRFRTNSTTSPNNT